MWHRASVEKFLQNQGVEPSTAEAINARMDAAVDERGLFPAGRLEEVMGGPELARALDEAWETDPSLMAALPRSLVASTR